MMGSKTKFLAEVGINTVLCCLVLVPSFAVFVLSSKTVPCTDPSAGIKHVGFSMQSSYVLCWHMLYSGYSAWRERGGSSCGRIS